MRLTEEGRRYLDSVRLALAALAEGEQALKQQTQGLSGVLQLAAPSDFGRNVLLPWLDDFKRQHPNIQLQLLLNDRHADLFRETVDVALRFGVPSDSTLVALPILPQHRRVACASPEYLTRRGTPQHPEELGEHSALLYLRNGRPYNHWRFSRGDEVLEVDVHSDYLSDDGEVARRWALAGHGIAYKAWLDVAADVQAGRLVTLFDDWQGESVPFNLLCPHRVQVSERVKVLQTFLQERCEALRR
jgi:DNA-binding transcriptional LysR family regulator